ncbi:MAG TPA: S-layer related protein (Precursor), partial [Planctomycetaceae bacterium]|nr:S-layer related protein (Precursor) [Planctomycetaceae bacterium]
MQMLKCLRVTGVLVVSFIATATGQELHITPDRVLLTGKFQQAQLLVNQKDSSNTSAIGLDDLTAAANYTVLDPNIARVDTQGRITALRDGVTKVTIAYQNLVQEIFVEVQGEKTTQIEFTQDILPILNKAGCAAGACHASQFGKGGFKLSIFGFDPQADFRAIARASRGRRLNFGSPKFSLLMAKPAMLVPHGGGRRLDPDTIGYEILREWISNGATTPAEKPVKAISLHVTPGQRATKLDETQQLRAVVKYSDASFRDVTSFARYDVMDEGVLSVTSDGLVTATGKGQSAVMVRYEGQVEAVTFVVPFGNRTQLANWKNHNFIDELAANKFRELQLEPSALCDDATFLRRAFLDAIGGLPTLTEASAFLDSQDPQKRTHLVERLLGLAKDPAENIYNDRYASFWTLKWSDLIRNNSNDLGEQGMWALHNWIKESFRTNKPYDQFVRELVTAKGSIYS